MKDDEAEPGGVHPGCDLQDVPDTPTASPGEGMRGGGGGGGV